MEEEEDGEERGRRKRERTKKEDEDGEERGRRKRTEEEEDLGRGRTGKRAREGGRGTKREGRKKEEGEKLGERKGGKGKVRGEGNEIVACRVASFKKYNLALFSFCSSPSALIMIAHRRPNSLSSKSPGESVQKKD